MGLALFGMVRHLSCLVRFFAILLFSATVRSTTQHKESCKQIAERNNKNVDVYWINMDSSTIRKQYMEEQLKHYGIEKHVRISAATPRDLLLPVRLAHPDVCHSISEASVKEFAKSYNISTLLRATTVTNHIDVHSYDLDRELPQSFASTAGGVSNEIDPTLLGRDRLPHAMDHGHLGPVVGHGPARQKQQQQHKSDYIALISDHCGRKKNTLRELTVTVSHLKALYFATRDLSSKYALILEDDVLLPNAIDLEMLAEQAPKDFGMIQFVTTNEKYLQQHWQAYTRTGDLWTLRLDQDLWCASAYLINKQQIRSVIDDIVISLGNNTYRNRIIAGYGKPCFPSQCCTENTENSNNNNNIINYRYGNTININNNNGFRGKTWGMTNNDVFVPRKHCIHAARGYQADNFMFALLPGKTYISNIPLVSNGRVGYNSTIHQEHVHSHHTASFKRVNNYLSEFATGSIKAPSFLSLECGFH